jgi:hypothetical protein
VKFIITILNAKLSHYLEYPPDANHGFYVGAAVITARLPRDSVQNATILARYVQNIAVWGSSTDNSI